jgi:hypothetical protein
VLIFENSGLTEAAASMNFTDFQNKPHLSPERFARMLDRFPAFIRFLHTLRIFQARCLIFTV